MSDKDHDISVLNNLIEVTLDSVDGYRSAAEDATNSRFASEFRDRANDREQVVNRLQDEVRRLGGEPEDSSSILASAHRAFMDLRDKVTGTNDKAVLDEVDRGESYLDDRWQKAMKDDQLSPEARSAISQCYSSIRSGHEQMEMLNRSMESTH